MRLKLLLLAVLLPALARPAEAPRHVPLTLRPDDVLATGNEWLALPDIRAADGALGTFNALSMRDRGLLQASGESAQPVLRPYFRADDKALSLQDPAWELLEYWIPEARQNVDGLELTVTYCAPNGYRAAFIRLTATNHRDVPVRATLGMKASFGRLSRVTYVPVVLRGERSLGPSPWVDPGEVFSYITHDTQFAWALVHPGSTATTAAPPLALSPEANAEHAAVL
jgi:hypothetical protein